MKTANAKPAASPARSCAVPSNPPLPVYDPAVDGNPFQWIVDQASAVRKGRAVIERLGCRPAN